MKKSRKIKNFNFVFFEDPRFCNQIKNSNKIGTKKLGIKIIDEKEFLKMI